MEKIVIFGGSGFIGSELIIKLANFKNFQVDVITRNKKTIHPRIKSSYLMKSNIGKDF